MIRRGRGEKIKLKGVFEVKEGGESMNKVMKFNGLLKSKVLEFE